MTKEEAYFQATKESIAESSTETRQDVIYRAMEIYARIKWDEACEAQKIICARMRGLNQKATMEVTASYMTTTLLMKKQF